MTFLQSGIKKIGQKNLLANLVKMKQKNKITRHFSLTALAGSKDN